MKRVNSRKVVDPRLANTIWRCSRINVLELNLLTKNTALERAIRRCLSSVAVQSLEIDRLESFDLGVQWDFLFCTIIFMCVWFCMFGSRRTYFSERLVWVWFGPMSLKNWKFRLTYFPLECHVSTAMLSQVSSQATLNSFHSEFIIDAMKSVETLEIFELFPTATHRLRFGTVKEDLLYLIQHLRVDWHLDAELLTRSDQQLRRFGPDYRSLIRVRTIVPIEISDSEWAKGIRIW